MFIMKPPWQLPPLDSWAICGMNHYNSDGEKRLFISMTKNGRCITVEGKDDRFLWETLKYKTANNDREEAEAD